MGVDNLRQFEVQLQRAVEEVPEAILEAQIAATKKAADFMRRAIPRASGPRRHPHFRVRAKDSIRVGSGPTSNRGRRGEILLRPNEQGPLSRAKPYSMTHAWSAVFYVRFLNDGNAQSPGRHFVERAAVLATDVLEAELR